MVGANPETLALEASVQSTYVCQKCYRDFRFSIITRLREVRCIEWWPTQHFKLDPFKRKNAGYLNIRFMSWENYSGSCLEKVAQVVQPWLRLYRLSVFTSLDCNIALYYLLWARWAAKASLPSSNYLFVATGRCWRRIASLLNQPNVWLASESEPYSKLQCLVFFHQQNGRLAQ